MKGAEKIILVPDCAAFFAHWSSLRKSDLPPTTETWINHLPPRFASRTIRCELLADDALVQFIGMEFIERWNNDITGELLYKRRTKDYRAQSMSNLRTLAKQPCGYSFVNELNSKKGRVLEVQAVWLPLAVRDGQAPRVVGYFADLGKFAPGDPVTTKSRMVKVAWIDTGAGVPTAPPHLTKQD